MHKTNKQNETENGIKPSQIAIASEQCPDPSFEFDSVYLSKVVEIPDSKRGKSLAVFRISLVVLPNETMPHRNRMLCRLLPKWKSVINKGSKVR